MVDKKNEEENYPTSVVLDIRSILEQMGMETKHWPEDLSPWIKQNKDPL